MLRHFEKLLELFPYSKLAQRGPTLRVYAIERVEPPQLEKEFGQGMDATQIVDVAREVMAEDSVAEVETAWDLWQYDEDWKVRPSAVTLMCIGPEFQNENRDHLRIEFGLDSRFLPVPGIDGSLRMGQSNLRSLLHLVNQIEQSLPLERRTIWSESGANFAEILAHSVSKFEVN
jgi:hypothetical protein